MFNARLPLALVAGGSSLFQRIAIWEDGVVFFINLLRLSYRLPYLSQMCLLTRIPNDEKDRHLAFPLF